jgi:hypothetical protein
MSREKWYPVVAYHIKKTNKHNRLHCSYVSTETNSFQHVSVWLITSSLLWLDLMPWKDFLLLTMHTCRDRIPSERPCRNAVVIQCTMSFAECICISIYMYMYTICIYIHICICICLRYVYVYDMYMYIYICIRYVYICIRYVYIYKYIYIYVYVYDMYKYIYMYMYTICIYIYMYMYCYSEIQHFQETNSLICKHIITLEHNSLRPLEKKRWI